MDKVHRPDRHLQKDFYDKAYTSQIFDKHYQENEKNSLLLDVLDQMNVQPNDSVLEIGCGNGLLTRSLITKTRRVHAIDISDSAIQYLKEKLKAAVDQGQLTAEAVDVYDYLRNTRVKFDFIIGSGILHHLEDVEQFFRLAASRLNPGGRITFFPEPNSTGFLGLFWKYLAPLAYRMFGIEYRWEIEKGALNIKLDYLKRVGRQSGLDSVDFLPFQVLPHFRFKPLARLDSLLRRFRFLSRISLYSIIICRLDEVKK